MLLNLHIYIVLWLRQVMKNLGLRIHWLASKMQHACIYSDNPRSQWLLQVNPDVLCECFLQTGFLHTSQHCFTLLAYSFAFCTPIAFPRPRMYAASHWRYHTFERYYTSSCSKLRHKANQKVLKCSLTYPLKNDIVTFYKNCTNKYGRVHKLRGGIHSPGYLGSLRYNFLMAWAIITYFIPLNVSKWTTNSYQKGQNFIPDARSVICKKPQRSGYHPPW